MTKQFETVCAHLLHQCKNADVISDELIVALHNVFQSNMVVEAAKLVDEKKIQSLMSESGRHIFKVKGSNEKWYMVSSSSFYCSCPSFTFQFLKKKSSYLCKHVLATFLYKRDVTTVTNEELTLFLMSCFDS
uniref:SWIM-type domain-containing protein n=1 Tax=Clytia hemisphaerica TaxID=252671 RepID=A0A7M5X0R2_9CNID|eukprot:TCONS_00027139-protein